MRRIMVSLLNIRGSILMRISPMSLFLRVILWLKFFCRLRVIALSLARLRSGTRMRAVLNRLLVTLSLMTWLRSANVLRFRLRMYLSVMKRSVILTRILLRSLVRVRFWSVVRVRVLIARRLFRLVLLLVKLLFLCRLSCLPVDQVHLGLFFRGESLLQGIEGSCRWHFS